MNIAMTEPKAAVSPSLKGKVSLVTGSTSGIGLGIARALAGAGSDVVLNGFGKPEEIEAAREGVAKDYGVRVDYSGADMSNPASIAEMIETTLAQIRPARHPRQQCRHPARGAVAGLPAGEVGRDPRHQSVFRLPHHAARAPLDDRQQMGAHHQHRLGARARRLAPTNRPTSPRSTASSG